MGDLVYVKRHFVADRGRKLRYPFEGPMRIMDMQGNTVILRSLATGKHKRSSMRELKLVRAENITKTESQNAYEPFPISED